MEDAVAGGRRGCEVYQKVSLHRLTDHIPTGYDLNSTRDLAKRQKKRKVVVVVVVVVCVCVRGGEAEQIKYIRGRF
jgi:hypothetical protein